MQEQIRNQNLVAAENSKMTIILNLIVLGYCIDSIFRRMISPWVR